MFQFSHSNSDEFNVEPSSRESDLNPDSPREADSKREPAIKSLQDLSNWIDAQLAALEVKYQSYETAESNRNYFSR